MRERVHQYSMFRTVRADGAQTYCFPEDQISKLDHSLENGFYDILVVESSLNQLVFGWLRKYYHWRTIPLVCVPLFLEDILLSGQPDCVTMVVHETVTIL